VPTPLPDMVRDKIDDGTLPRDAPPKREPVTEAVTSARRVITDPACRGGVRASVRRRPTGDRPSGAMLRAVLEELRPRGSLPPE
jgi:hypothetical protein